MLRPVPAFLSFAGRINSDLYCRGRHCRRFVLHRILSSRIQFPASLCSTPITALHGYYGRSDSCQGRLFVALGPMNTDRLPLTGLSASCTRTSDHSVPKHIMPSRHYHALPLGIPVARAIPHGRLRHLLAGSPRHHAESSLTFVYGLVIHLQLLPTRPHDHAVTFSYGPENECPKRTFTSLITYTCRRTTSGRCPIAVRLTLRAQSQKTAMGHRPLNKRKFFLKFPLHRSSPASNIADRTNTEQGR